MKRPTTGERLRQAGAPTAPRAAASVIVVRDGAGELEVLLVQRSPQQRFMGGFWVFPGGAVDAGEDLRAAAVRELAEEASIAVEPGALVPYSRWITPEKLAIRFDTQFFVIAAPDGAAPRVDGAECVDLRWIAPSAAVAAYGRDELALVFPTLSHLQELAPFATVGALLAHAGAPGREIRPILPRVVLEGDARRILLPGEPGYDDEQ